MQIIIKNNIIALILPLYQISMKQANFKFPGTGRNSDNIIFKFCSKSRYVIQDYTWHSSIFIPCIIFTHEVIGQN